jgi:hypothetical protein
VLSGSVDLFDQFLDLLLPTKEKVCGVDWLMRSENLANTG